MMVTSFTGEYRFLSNFYPSTITLFDKDFPTVEHAYQALKAVYPNDRELIRTAPTPGAAKRLGRRVQSYPAFQEQRLIFMNELVGAKFRRHEDLRLKLLATEDAELIEGNTWNDTFWGVCNGIGSNHLGRILMRTRTQLRSTL